MKTKLNITKALLALVAILTPALASAQGVRCNEPRCDCFNKAVWPQHVHNLPCTDTRCTSFNRHVPPGHIHWDPCTNPRCTSFMHSVPVTTHVHTLR